jgi:hypothetical protein
VTLGAPRAAIGAPIEAVVAPREAQIETCASLGIPSASLGTPREFQVTTSDRLGIPTAALALLSASNLRRGVLEGAPSESSAVPGSALTTSPVRRATPGDSIHGF